MKRLIPALIVLFLFQSSTLKSQFVDNPEFIESIQGTWAFAEKDAPFWYKVFIAGNNFTIYEAEQGEGKFSTYTTIEIIKSVKTTFRGGNNGESSFKTYAQLGCKNLNFDVITLEIVNGKTILDCGKFKKGIYQNFIKLVSVPIDFNPWK
jgi:hypothetical protein